MKKLLLLGLGLVGLSQTASAAITVDTAPILADITSVSGSGVTVAIAVAVAVIGIRMVYKLIK
jgi:hypothetical protein